jgi:CheY-like chemotaxis protein
VNILLAEDNPVNQKLAKMMLTKAGYQVAVANNGQEAVENITSSPEDFDLIFMDVQMPKMGGVEATKAIRERGFNTIPIVAMTAHAMEGDKEKCLEAGMDDYISKPIKREIVFEILEKWVFDRKA